MTTPTTEAPQADMREPLVILGSFAREIFEMCSNDLEETAAQLRYRIRKLWKEARLGGEHR